MVSDKNDKTIVVRVETLVKHPVLKKYIRHRKKFMAETRAVTVNGPAVIAVTADALVLAAVIAPGAMCLIWRSKPAVPIETWSPAVTLALPANRLTTLP